jgi:SPP1 family predicted phage head-tail adaptor
MRAGRLDRRIDIEIPVQQRTPLGDLVITWSRLMRVAARLLPQSAAMRVLGPELVSEQAVVWSIRYRGCVTSKCRIRHGEHVYRIRGIHQGSGRDVETMVVTVREEPERGTG